MTAALVPAATFLDPIPPDSSPDTDRRRSSVGVTLLPLQLFLAAGWGRAGLEKVIDPTWWSAQHLRAFLDEQRPDMFPWYRWISDHLLEPFAPQLFALSRPVARTIAMRRAILWMVPATLVLPFARTLRPSEVIEDPALMLSFLGVVAAATTLARSYRAADVFQVIASTRIGSWAFRALVRFGVRFDVSVPPSVPPSGLAPISVNRR